MLFAMAAAAVVLAVSPDVTATRAAVAGATADVILTPHVASSAARATMAVRPPSIARQLRNAGAPSTAQRRGVTLTDLQNFTYFLGENASVEGGKVPLANGRWDDPVGGSSFSLHRLYATGDLDGNGTGDAVAILVEATGGSGSFYYMFAIAYRDGAPVQLGEPEWLGDRTVVERVQVDRRGIITVRYVTHADGDPACCPTMRIEDRYRVEDGKLVGLLQ